MVRLSYFHAVLVLAFGLGYSAPVFADVEDGTRLDPAFVAPFIAWVEHETGTHIPVQPQVIASRDRFDLELDHMHEHHPGRPQSGYVPGTVILDNTRWDPEDPAQLSLLVHELVHHAQLFMKDKVWACSNEKEVLAYTLQNKWLEEHGHSPFVQASWIKRVSTCPGTAVVADRE
jgi:hypothetical protein